MSDSDVELEGFLAFIESSRNVQRSPHTMVPTPDCVEKLPVFIHQPLQDGDFRLLDFIQGSDEAGPIQLQIRNCRLEDDERRHTPDDTVRPYSALSYVWGNGGKNTPIIMNGCSFSVTEDLHFALLYLRNLYATNTVLPRSLWIDAICIDQHNNNEKSIQVALMRSIYRSADHVVVWLGMATPGITEEVFSMLENSIVLNPARHDAIDDVLLKRVTENEWFIFGADIMRRPWWRRMWVIQEIALAKHALVMCGPYVTEWKKLEAAGVWAQILETPAYVHTNAEIARGDVFLPNVRFKRAYRMNLQVQRPIPILELLLNNAPCKATDARDMVFSLIWLATDVEAIGVQDREQYNGLSVNEKRQVLLDYDRSPEQVYIDLVHVLANTHNSLDILSFNGYVKDLTLPSWVPDWTCVWKTTVYILAPVEHVHPAPAEFANQLPTRYRYNASVGLDPDFSFVGNDKLHVSGIDFDTIQTIGQPFLDSNPPGEVFYQALLAWKTLALGESSEHAAEAYISGGTKAVAFQRCITADQTRYGERVVPGAQAFDHDAERAVYLRIGKRAFFLTQKGYFGIGPPYARQGDHVCVLSGCKVPFVLRKVGQEWEVVGECFVLGVMDGEVVQMGLERSKFVLR
ncbi:heterokaryon incompatibility protein-domain-containing protein [Pyrenochaeta sp. MPI-SDFR-AT-0127]|nr:heterokaryon incompatibility protein-domain-containing protein [Pyrenochaeta sp. MPI-SDFR-AT-0127]